MNVLLDKISRPVIPPWMLFALGEYGVSEIPGRSHEPRILQYHQATALKATSDEISWCASFANFCLESKGIKGTNSAAARSFLNNYGSKIIHPAYGCIVVTTRGSQRAPAQLLSWEGEKGGYMQGHVGFMGYEGHESILLLAGNQSNKVSIAEIKKSDVLAYIWP